MLHNTILCFNLCFFKSKFPNVGRGRNRIAFSISKKYIAKIPLNEEGVYDNCFERRSFKNRRNPQYPYARCRMCGDFVLIMEKLDLKINKKYLPDWVKWVDCAQVGYDSRGILKIYDYGYY